MQFPIPLIQKPHDSCMLGHIGQDMEGLQLGPETQTLPCPLPDGPEENFRPKYPVGPHPILLGWSDPTNVGSLQKVHLMWDGRVELGFCGGIL